MNLYWIASDQIRLAIAPRPRGDEWLADDVRSLKEAGVDVLVSALTRSEAEELGLTSEEGCCRRSGLEFLSFPVEDRSVPAKLDTFDTLLNNLKQRLGNGKRVAVHCRAGIGRSAIIVACLLMRNGFSSKAAFLAIEKARGLSVPDTEEQRRWVEQYSFGPSQ